MRVLILSSSPNTDGLTAACVAAVRDGLRRAGCEATEIRLTESEVGCCRQCGNGWGSCLPDGICQVADGFQSVHAAVRDAAALVLVTPVYWGDYSESAKAFTDRLRRCEATRGEAGVLAGRWFMGVAAAGGTGGGTVSCLEQMERLAAHMRMQRWDLVAITRRTRESRLEAISVSAEALAHALDSKQEE